MTRSGLLLLLGLVSLGCREAAPPPDWSFRHEQEVVMCFNSSDTGFEVEGSGRVSFHWEPTIGGDPTRAVTLDLFLRPERVQYYAAALAAIELESEDCGPMPPPPEEQDGMVFISSSHVGKQHLFRMSGRDVSVASPAQAPCELEAVAKELVTEVWALVASAREGNDS